MIVDRRDLDAALWREGGLRTIDARLWAARRVARVESEPRILRQWIDRLADDCEALIDRLRDRGDA